MIGWLGRLRIALILSPALLLWHVWILVCSSGYLVQTYGLPLIIGGVVVSSIIEAYIIVMAAATAKEMWQK